MKCPRCETTTLDEKDREGVVVDACAQCRGIWLDRGELEKLIARATRDLDEMQEQRPASQSARPQERSYPPPDPNYQQTPPHAAQAQYQEPPRHRRDSDPDYRYDSRDPRYKHRRKKSFLESFGDIFD